MTCDIIFLSARSALNEKSLERYLESLLGDRKRLSMLYDDWAFLRYTLPGSVVKPDPVGSETFSRIRDPVTIIKILPRVFNYTESTEKKSDYDPDLESGSLPGYDFNCQGLVRICRTQFAKLGTKTLIR
jgi:hypothetical protein